MTRDTLNAWHPEAGEQILWTGAPLGRIEAGIKDLFLVPFSIIWCGFAFVWEYNAIKIFITTGNKPYIFFSIFGSIFVLVGIYLLIGRFFYEAYVAGNTSYILTDRRAVILIESFPKRLQSIFTDKLDTIGLVAGKGTAGSVTFGKGSYSSYYNNSVFYNQVTGMYQQNGVNVPFYNPPPGFYNIENAAKVHQLILKQMKKEP
jgi:hypothetical protein